MPQNKSIHTFENGLIRIDNKSKQPKNSYSFGLNLIPDNNVLDNTTRSNEKGFDDYASLKEVDYNIVGCQWLGNEEYVFFIKHIEGETPFNEIRLVNKKDNSNKLLYSNLLLNFQDNKEIISTFRINYKNQRVVYWVDGLNDDRVINVDEDSTLLDIGLLSIETSAKAPVIELKVEEELGAVTSGRYFILISYGIGESFTTSPLTISNGVNIVSEEYFADQPVNNDNSIKYGLTDGDVIPIPTNKAIRINISEVDLNYDTLNIIIAKSTNDGFNFRVISNLDINTTEFIYTGNEGEIDETLDLSQITVDSVKYYASEAITQKENRLIRGNTKLKTGNIDYQSFANNIKVEYTINEVIVRDAPLRNGNDYWDIPNDSPRTASRHSLSPSYQANTGNSNIDNASLMRDEVYSLGIGFELIDGTETDVFHIPGRLPNDVGVGGNGEFSRALSSTFDTALVPGTSNPYWRERNTAVKKSSTGGLLGYWRSEEIYKDGSGLPDNGEKNGSNKSYIRHHKMPSDVLEPIHRTIGSGNNLIIYKRNLGLKFTNIVIPEEFKNQIRSIKFFYTPRNNSNKSILTKGVMMPLPLTSGYYTEPNHLNKNLTRGDHTVFKFHSPEVDFKFKEALIKGNRIKVNSINRADVVYMRAEAANPQWVDTRDINGNITYLVQYFNNELKASASRDSAITNSFAFYGYTALPKENSSTINTYTAPIRDNFYLDWNFKGAANELNFNRLLGQQTSIIYLDSPIRLTSNNNLLNSEFPTLNYPESTVNPSRLHENSILRVDKTRHSTNGNWQAATQNFDTMRLDVNTPKYDTIQYVSIVRNINNAYGKIELLEYVPFNKTSIYDGKDVLSIDITGGDVVIDIHHFKSTYQTYFDNVTETNAPVAFNPEAINNASKGALDTNSKLTPIYEQLNQSFVSFICESDIPFRMRREDKTLGDNGNYFPKSYFAFTTLRDLGKQADKKELFYIDPAYEVNNLKLYYSAHNISNNSSTGDIRYSTRVIYSDKQELEDKIDNYRTVRANNYRDLPLNRGSITTFFIQQDRLYAITRDSLFNIVASNQSIQTESGDNIVVGTGEFLSIEPTEIVSIEGGFGGTSSKWSLAETPYGYLFVDRLKNKVLLFTADLKDINILGLNENFELELYKQFPELTTDNNFDDPIKGVGIISIYDSANNRVLITKRDSKALSSTIDNYKGIYNALTSYNIGDVVTYNGNLVIIQEGDAETEIVNESNFSTWNIDNTNLYEGDIIIGSSPTNGSITDVENTVIKYTLNTGISDSFTINQSGSTCAYETVNITKATYPSKWIVDEEDVECVQEVLESKWIGDIEDTECVTVPDVLTLGISEFEISDLKDNNDNILLSAIPTIENMFTIFDVSNLTVSGKRLRLVPREGRVGWNIFRNKASGSVLVKNNFTENVIYDNYDEIYSVFKPEGLELNQIVLINNSNIDITYSAFFTSDGVINSKKISGTYTATTNLNPILLSNSTTPFKVTEIIDGTTIEHHAQALSFNIPRVDNSTQIFIIHN